MIYTEQRHELMRLVTKFCMAEVEPLVQEWDQARLPSATL